MAILNHSAEGYTPSTYELIPKGSYNAIIETSEKKKTRRGDGSYISLRIKIIDGAQKGKTAFCNLNNDNPNPITVKIALEQLSEIMFACGKKTLSDSAELHNIPMLVTVKIEDGKDGYADQNKFTSFKPLAATAPTTASASAPSGAMPWENQ